MDSAPETTNSSRGKGENKCDGKRKFTDAYAPIYISGLDTGLRNGMGRDGTGRDGQEISAPPPKDTEHDGTLSSRQNNDGTGRGRFSVARKVAERDGILRTNGMRLEGNSVGHTLTRKFS